ncbi:MAG: SDR family NAD(P)-dependent oxidoreductase [Acetobacteraceae bacterium]
MRLHGKTALITGGTSGIGLATARLFIAEGAQVALTGRDPTRLATAAGELGPDALPIEADAATEAGTAAAVAATLARFGRLDIVIANAGIGGATRLGATSAAAFEAILRTNLTGVFLTVQAAAPHLPRGGAVVLLGSVHEVLGVPGWAAYAASKGGVRAMARVLAGELAPAGIRVNVVSPGATRTPLWDAVAPTADARATLEARMARAIPLGRLAEPEDVARTILFLASDDAAHVQAAEIFVDGGHTGAPAAAPVHAAPAARG